ncbi:hypothetical protein BG004_005008, partial [Podila humilis]
PEASIISIDLRTVGLREHPPQNTFRYSVSRNGRHLVTLFIIDNFIKLHAWDLIGSSTSHVASFSLRATSAVLNLDTDQLHVSISSDGSIVAVAGADEPLHLFNLANGSFTQIPEEDILVRRRSPAEPERNHDDDEPIQPSKRSYYIEQFTGICKFTTTQGGEERFLACDGFNVIVYSINTLTKIWREEYCIPLSTTRNLVAAQFLINAAHHDHFFWLKGTKLYIWDIDSGNLKSCVSLPDPPANAEGESSTDLKVLYLFSDRKHLALKVGKAKSLLLSITTGHLLDSSNLSIDTLIMVEQFRAETCGGSLVPMPTRKDLKFDKSFLPKKQRDAYGMREQTGKVPRMVFEQDKSVLKVTKQLQANALAPSSQTRHECSDGHGEVGVTIGDGEHTLCTSNGTNLRFSLQQLSTAQHPCSDPSDIPMQAREGEIRPKILRVCIMPDSILHVRHLALTVQLDASYSVSCFPMISVMAIYNPQYISIWRLPTTTAKACRLLLHWHDRKTNEKFVNGQVFDSREAFVKVQCCEQRLISYHVKAIETSPKPTQETGAETTEEATEPIGKASTLKFRLSDDYNAKHYHLFTTGIEGLLEWFSNCDSTSFREEVMRYLGDNINMAHGSKCTLSVICDIIQKDKEKGKWRMRPKSGDRRDLITGILKILPMWIPQERYVRDDSPLLRLLKFAEEHGSVLVVVEEVMTKWIRKIFSNDNGYEKYIYVLLECLPTLLKVSRRRPVLVKLSEEIIQRCLEMAKRDKNPMLLDHILSCMPEMQILYPDLALKTTRSFAYFEAPDRQLVVDNHTIANPPWMSRWFNSESPRLYECYNPTLQFKYNPDEPDKNNEYFTQDIFVAPFSMLWKVDNLEENLAGDGTGVVGSTNHGVLMRRMTNDTRWWKAIPMLLLIQLFPTNCSHIQPRYYKLQMLDNPAIKALVEFKWNTFAYLLWLVRFTLQCIFYVLIITAAAMQIYYDNPSVLLGVFAAIIAMAGWFLLQELWQIVESWAELRVMRVVCKYVTIVLQILSDIKLFLAAFAVGITVFALAIEHILRGRNNGAFRESNDGITFPFNFLGAVTNTYFIMGGRYDPVSEGLSSDDDVALHLMILIYFFFTVILMLNVLIALINGGYSKGDSDWRLVWLDNRLRYVESAENMSYHIAGFRSTYNWFPREIYYTAKAEKVKSFLETDIQEQGNNEDLDEKAGNSGGDRSSSSSSESISALASSFSQQLQKVQDEISSTLEKQQKLMLEQKRLLEQLAAGGSR